MTALATRPAPRTTTQNPRPYVRVKTDAIAAAVDASGFTHRELAIKAKLKSHATVTNLTTGYRKTCHRDTAKRLARALRMDGSKLFEICS